MFDEFSADTDQTSDQLLNNLQSQVDGLRDWRDNLNALEKRGIDPCDLIDVDVNRSHAGGGSVHIRGDAGQRHYR